MQGNEAARRNLWSVTSRSRTTRVRRVKSSRSHEDKSKCTKAVAVAGPWTRKHKSETRKMVLHCGKGRKEMNIQLLVRSRRGNEIGNEWKKDGWWAFATVKDKRKSDKKKAWGTRTDVRRANQKVLNGISKWIVLCEWETFKSQDPQQRAGGSLWKRKRKRRRADEDVRSWEQRMQHRRWSSQWRKAPTDSRIGCLCETPEELSREEHWQRTCWTRSLLQFYRKIWRKEGQGASEQRLRRGSEKSGMLCESLVWLKQDESTRRGKEVARWDTQVRHIKEQEQTVRAWMNGSSASRSKSLSCRGKEALANLVVRQKICDNNQFSGTKLCTSEI